MQPYATILIAEDSATLRFVYQYTLAEQYTLLFATDARQTLELALRHRPDAIVLDVNLLRPRSDGPDLLTQRLARVDGIDLCAMIKRSPLGQTPVLVCTGRSDLRTRFRARRAGADRYLTKPVAAEQIRGTLAELTASARIGSRLRTSATLWSHTANGPALGAAAAS